MFSGDVDWVALKKDCYTISTNAKTITELQPAFELILNRMRDHHGRILSAKDYSIVAHFTDWDQARHQDDREKTQEHWAIVNDIEARFSSSYLGNGVGYLKVVGIGPQTAGQTEANQIRSAIDSLHLQGITQWILDLRFNGGGDAHTMMAGLAPLFDEGQIIQLTDGEDHVVGGGNIENGNFTYFGYQSCEMSSKPDLKKPKIAVLLSRWTVSSGELVAVALKDQENVKFFGEASGGMTTNTGGEPILDDVILVISTGTFADRNGKSFPHSVDVDVETPLQLDATVASDICIQQAIKWLSYN